MIDRGYGPCEPPPMTIAPAAHAYLELLAYRVNSLTLSHTNVNRVIKKTIPMPLIAPEGLPVFYIVSRNPLNSLDFLPRYVVRDGVLRTSVY